MRLGIFLFYDGDGRVSDHVSYLLAKFCEHLDRLVVVSNGPVSAEGEATLMRYASELVVRENVGYDVGGYVDGLRIVGFDALDAYDEVVLFNYTVFGPVFDLDEMFQGMGQKDIDFWGVTEFSDPNKEFLQSYFLVTRKRLHGHPDFRDYWLSMPPIKSVDDSINYHEFRFTQHFVDRGYRKAAYVQNAESWQGNTTLVDLPGLLDRRLPIIKYRAFNFDEAAIERRGGLPPAENFRILAERTDYPVDMAWDYIISQTPVDQLITSVTRLVVTDDAPAAEADTDEALSRCAVFLSIEDAGAVDRLLAFFDPFDPRRLHGVSSNPAIVERLTRRGWTARVSDHPMTGAPIAAFADLLTTALSDEDIVLNLSCFNTERDTYGLRDTLVENYWQPLASQACIAATARMFDANPRLGIAFAPTDSVFGRLRRIEPLCPRAENWTFDSYPRHLARAVTQANWPWRGNAALSGRLVRHQTFRDLLATTWGSVRHGKMTKVAGIEATLPELARQAGFAPQLVSTSAQAVKLVARWSVAQRNFQTALEQRMRPLASRSAEDEAEISALRESLAEAERRVSNAESTVLSNRRNASAVERELRAELSKIRRRVETLEGSFQQLVPPEVQGVQAVAITPDAIRLKTATTEGNPASELVLARAPIVLGALNGLRVTEDGISFKGWCYSANDPNETVFIAVTDGKRVIRPFSACIFPRRNVVLQSDFVAPHHNCGFALTIRRDETPAAPDDLQVIFVSVSLKAAYVMPLREGAITNTALGSPKLGAA